MVVPQECRRIGASAFVVFDIVPAGGAAQLLPMAQTAAVMVAQHSHAPGREETRARGAGSATTAQAGTSAPFALN